MEDVGSNQGSKRVCTNEQDNTVQCLVEMKNDGKYMMDNGFRSGYLSYIEGYINEKVPRCGIKGMPHIQSRLKTLKTTWQVMYDMVHGSNISEFGWNPNTNTVTTPNAVWNEYLKSHKKAAPFKFKPFPHFENLCIVWAKDRTSGRDAETITDILNTDVNLYVGEDTAGIGDMNTNQDDELNGVSTEQPSTPSTDATSVSRKRHRNDNDVLVEALTNSLDLMDKRFMEATTEIATQIRRVAHKANLAKKTEKLWEELTKISSFTEEEMAKAALMIRKDETMLVIFPTLPPNVKSIIIRDYIK